MKSFVYAFRGILDTIKHERNMRIHFCFAYYVVLAGIITHISRSEWTAVLICIGMVTALECLNTSLENLCDTLHPEKSEGIRLAKDTAAGAVLCAAIASAVAGGFVFFRMDKIDLALTYFGDNPIVAVLLVIAVPSAALLLAASKKDKKKG